MRQREECEGLKVCRAAAGQCAAMESRQLFVFGVLLACGALTDALQRGTRPPSYWEAVMRSLEAMQAQPRPPGPVKQPSRASAESAGPFHSKRIRPADDQPQWKFPEAPAAPPSRRPVRFEAQRPEPSERVAVRCGESRIHVEVSQDLLGISKLIAPDEITLGGCPPAGVDPSARVLIFESELHDCGSTLEVSQDGLVYSFQLIHNPKVLGSSPIIRSQRTVVDVECRYTN